MTFVSGISGFPGISGLSGWWRHTIRIVPPFLYLAFGPQAKTGERGGHPEMIQVFFVETLVFEGFCFGNIGIPGDIGAIGKVCR